MVGGAKGRKRREAAELSRARKRVVEESNGTLSSNRRKRRWKSKANVTPEGNGKRLCASEIARRIEQAKRDLKRHNEKASAPGANKAQASTQKCTRSQIDRLVTEIQHRFCSSGNFPKGDSLNTIRRSNSRESLRSTPGKNSSQARRLPWELYTAHCRRSIASWNPESIVLRLPPWLTTETSKGTKTNTFGKLHNEIVKFYQYVSLDDAEVTVRLELKGRLEELAKQVWDDRAMEIETFGSFVGPLSLFYSDVDARVRIRRVRVNLESAPKLSPIDVSNSVLGSAASSADARDIGASSSGIDTNSDLMLNISHEEILPDVGSGSLLETEPADSNCNTQPGKLVNDDAAYEMQTWVHRNEVVDTLFPVFRTLRSSSNRSWVKGVSFRKRAKVPIVWFRTKENIECDIGVAGHGVDSVNTIQRLLERFDELPYLVVPLKMALKQSNLDKTFSGGLSSFKLYMLVAKHLEAIHKHVSKGTKLDLGGALMSFLGYFGQSRNLNRATEVTVERLTITFVGCFNLHLVTTLFTRMQVALLGKLPSASNGDFLVKLFNDSLLSRLYHTVELCLEREQSKGNAKNARKSDLELHVTGGVLDTVNSVLIQTQEEMKEVSPMTLKQVHEADRVLAAHLVEMIIKKQRSTRRKSY